MSSTTLCTVHGHALAEHEPSHQMPDVVVSGASEQPLLSTQPSRAEFKVRIENTPGGIGAVNREEFEQGRVSTFADSLGYATGVFIQPRFGADEARLSIRGSGVQRTFHGRGVWLTQDGIPVNLADGSFDFQAIEPLAADHVAVYRGANAFGLGVASLGGAIDYVSQTGLTAPRAAARMETGSFGYLRSAVQGAFKDVASDGYWMLSQSRQDGFRDFSKQDSVKLVGNLGRVINPDVQTRFFMASARSNSQLPGNLTLDQIQQNPQQANATNAALRQRRDLNLDRFSNRTRIRIGEGVLDVNGYVSSKELFHPIFQVIEQNNLDWGGQLKYALPHTLWGMLADTAVGLAYGRGVTDNTNRANNGGVPAGPLLDQSRQRAENQSFFIENRLALQSDLLWITALQFQQSQRQYDGYNSTALGGTGQFLSFERQYGQISPRVGIIKTLADQSQVYANLSRSFEPPSFGELGVSGTAGQFTINNAAQDGVSVEAGYRGEQLNWGWDVSAYYAEVYNELMATVIPGTTISSTFNAPETHRLGLELGLRYSAGAWTFRNSTLLNHFRFASDPDFGDARIAGLPAAATRLSAERLWNSGWRTSLSMDAAGPTWVDHKNTLQAPGYGVFNARVSVPLGLGAQPSAEWFVDARNLGDKRYVATTSVVRQFNPAQAAQFLPGDGRSLYAGVQIRW
ncbi:TonB-dependent receptor [Limnobacter humi]|uniref:TonB-dependent receptor n=1 Tax=Limnobacter humi TaxID=1778671 RepID=A0ABT1WE55_9BURK|nr:TonB-dependent receptor [Limnobacter humi]MCQ8895798.1 TonB-dependent receptor [Limnobacter humi]